MPATRGGAGDGWGGLTGGFWSFSFVSVVTLERGNDQNRNRRKKKNLFFLIKKTSSFVENYNLSLINSMFSVIKSFNNLDDADNITMLPLALNFVIF